MAVDHPIVIQTTLSKEECPSCHAYRPMLLECINSPEPANRVIFGIIIENCPYCKAWADARVLKKV
jgi:hypothetical protein